MITELNCEKVTKNKLVEIYSIMPLSYDITQ